MITFLAVILIIALALLGIVGILVPLLFIAQLPSDLSLMNIIRIIIAVIYFYNYFTVVRYLLRIIKSLETTPFVHNTVKMLKVIGWSLLINAVFECIEGYSIYQGRGMRVFGTDSGGISVPMVICFISALMSFVFAEAFDKAIKIKEDNDLTI